jgi:protein SCO1/2
MTLRWLAPWLCALGAGTLAPAQAQDSAVKLDAQTALRDSQAAVGRELADHTLLDARERPVRLSQFRGKPLLVSFIYTGCFQVCPTTTRSLADAVAKLSQDFGASSFNVVSIGFNQPFDSPQAMRAFAQQMRVGAPNWEFLSPPPATVQALTDDFGFRYLATPAGFDHVLTVSVVDAGGKLYQQVYGERLTRDQLGEPLRRLLRNAPLSVDAPLADLIERVRIICTVYDPETGTYRFKYGLLIEIAGGVTFLVAMLWFFALEWRTRRRLRRASAAAGPSLAPASK